MKKILILLFAIIMTGCTADFKVNEDMVENISDKITETLINTVENDNLKKLETHTIDASRLNKINIEGSVGDIYITTHDSKDAIIDVNLESIANSKEKSEEIINNFNYTVEEKWNTIIVNTKNSINEYINGEGIKANLNIKLPSTIENIAISSNVGEIKIENIKAKIEANSNVGDITIINSNTSYKVKTDVGKIMIKNCIAQEKSDFNTNTGNINLVFDDISNANNIYAETQVGDISLTLPDNSDYEAEIKEFMKDKRTETKGKGHTAIKLTTNVGSIDF